MNLAAVKVSTVKRVGAIVGVAISSAAATHDIWGMLGYREPNHRWVSEITMPLMLIVALSILFRTFAVDPQRVRDTISRSAVGLAVVAVSVLSVRWSINRQETILELRYLVVATLLGMALATVRPLTILVHGLALFGVAVVGVGALLSSTDTRYVFEGNWQGLFGNRNGFGACIAFVWPAILVASKGAWVRRLAGLASAGLIGWALFETQSKTATMTVVVVTLIWLAISLVPRFPLHRFTQRVGYLSTGTVTAVVVGVVALAAVALAAGGPFSVDWTFTNRTKMWQALLPYAKQEWFHGFGFHAFWSGSGGYLRSAQLSSGTGGTGTDMITAHNGFTSPRSLSWMLVSVGLALPYRPSRRECTVSFDHQMPVGPPPTTGEC